MKLVHLGIGVVPIPSEDLAVGIEPYIYYLTDHLGRMGCDVHIIDIKGGSQIKRRQQSSAQFHEVYRFPLPRTYKPHFLQNYLGYVLLVSQHYFFALSSIIPLYRLLAKEKIEVIHTHQRDAALAAVIVNKLNGNHAIVIYTEHLVPSKLKGWRRNLIHFAEILALKWVDHIITPTPALKDQLVSEFNVDPAKVTQIYNGVELDESEKFLSHKVSTCHQSNIVLCAGVICPRKNQLTAIKTIPQLVEAHCDIMFNFVGPIIDMNYFNLIKKFIGENRLSPYVEFKGQIKKQDLYNLYSDAKVFLFPTIAETQGIVLLEAMAFGLPVIASKIGPIVDVVSQNYGSAILVDPFDVDAIAMGIIRLNNDRTLWQSTSEKAKELAQILSNEKVASHVFSLYNKLVQNKKQGKGK
jgi:glycosyltransferase involved in cell wall biosynthesis